MKNKLTAGPVRIIFDDDSGDHGASTGSVFPVSGFSAFSLEAVFLKIISTTLWTRRSLPNSPGENR